MKGPASRLQWFILMGREGENKSYRRDSTPGSPRRVKEEEMHEGRHRFLQGTFPLKKGETFIFCLQGGGIKP